MFQTAPLYRQRELLRDTESECGRLGLAYGTPAPHLAILSPAIARSLHCVEKSNGTARTERLAKALSWELSLHSSAINSFSDQESRAASSRTRGTNVTGLTLDL